MDRNGGTSWFVDVQTLIFVCRALQPTTPPTTSVASACQKSTRYQVKTRAGQCGHPEPQGRVLHAMHAQTEEAHWQDIIFISVWSSWWIVLFTYLWPSFVCQSHMKHHVINTTGLGLGGSLLSRPFDKRKGVKSSLLQNEKIKKSKMWKDLSISTQPIPHAVSTRASLLPST